MSAPKTISEMRRAMQECYQRKDFARAFTWGDSILNAHRRPGNTEGADTAAFACDAYNLGLVCQTIGDYKMASELYCEAVSAFQKENPLCPEAVYPLTNLAVIQSKENHPQDALNLYLQAIKIMGAIGSKSSIDCAAALCNLGNCFADIGNPAEALQYLQLAEQAVKSNTSREGAELHAHILNNLGYLNEPTDLNAAITYLERGLAAMRRLGSNEDELTRCVYYLAGVCAGAGNHRKAVIYYNDALRMIKKSCQGKTQYYPTCLNSLANMLAKLGELEQSMALRMEAILQIKTVVGVRNMFYAGNIKNMGDLYLQLGNLDKAAELLQESVEVKSQLLGQCSQEVIDDMLALLDVRIRQGGGDKAIEIFLQLLERIGADYAQHEDIINKLAKIYLEKLGDINGLNEIYSKAMELYGMTHEMGEDDERG